ncbi:MAG: DUF1501 domain-containing protein [Candidatus Brocadiae bacterium]|nr:DUF1501 domain-containing protein [Candidatus Brocadiia bacterium]
MPAFNRRDFLRSAGGAALAAWAHAGLSPLRALAEDPVRTSLPKLVVLYLRGGADPINIVIPWSDPTYRKLRPGLAVGAPGTPGGCLELTKEFGLHPAMGGLHALWGQGLVAPILNVGSPHPTRSHFDAQDFMEYAAPGVRTITEGWLNRWLTATNEGARRDVELRALAAQPLLPRSLRGQFPVLAVPEDKALASMDKFEDLYGGEKKEGGGGMEERPAAGSERILGAGQETIRKLRFLQEILSRPGGRGAAAFPASRLGRQLQGIAQVIKADVGLEVAAADVPGWDHHARQGGPDGQMATMLGDLSSSIAAFTEDLGPDRMKSTLVLVMSEFGRTVAENGNDGTDHGHGGMMLAVGGPVSGGKIYGKWTGLETAQLYEGRDMPVHTDFRLVFAEVLAAHAKLAKSETFFPDWKPAGPMLGFLRNA